MAPPSWGYNIFSCQIPSKHNEKMSREGVLQKKSVRESEGLLTLSVVPAFSSAPDPGGCSRLREIDTARSVLAPLSALSMKLGERSSADHEIRQHRNETDLGPGWLTHLR